MKIFCTLFLAVALLSGCSEDEPAVTIYSKVWKVSMQNKHMSTNPDGRILNNAWKICEQDDTYTFLEGGVLSINFGENECDEPAASHIPFTYNPKTKALNIDGLNFTVAEISKTQLKYYAFIYPGSGYDYVVYLFE